MKRYMRNRIILGVAVAAILGAVYVAFADSSPAPVKKAVPYTVEEGDTIYTIAGRVATKYDNVNELSSQICHDNGITDPGMLQPGTRLIILVDPGSEVLHGSR